MDIQSIQTKSLRGKIEIVKNISGKVKVMEKYSGDYYIIPQAFKTQKINTANKILSGNITVVEIPYFETSNSSDGKTVYIAKEI